MGKIRFSIGQTLVLIGFMAVVFAALRTPSELWASVIFSLTWTALLLAVLAAMFGRERQRAFWTGFALFGSANLFVALSFPASKYLLATQALNAAREWLSLETAPLAGTFISKNVEYVFPAWVWADGTPVGAPLLPFLMIGHSLFALLFGVIGGLAALAFSRSNSRNEPKERTAGGADTANPTQGQNP